MSSTRKTSSKTPGKTQVKVLPGDVWEDLDPRNLAHYKEVRRVRVLEVDEKTQKASVESLSKRGIRSRIALPRFGTTKTGARGYKLIERAGKKVA